MLHHVHSVKPLDNWNLKIAFEDGTSGIVDIAAILQPFRGVFIPLNDLEYFRRVFVDPDLLVVSWPNGADLDSDALYEIVTEGKHNPVLNPA